MNLIVSGCVQLSREIKFNITFYNSKFKTMFIRLTSEENEEDKCIKGTRWIESENWNSLENSKNETKFRTKLTIMFP